MLDEVFERLYRNSKSEKRTDLEELYRIIKESFLEEKDAEYVMDFLKKYFIEVDEETRQVKLSPWTYSLFEMSIA